LDEVDKNSIFKTGHLARYPQSLVWLRLADEPPALAGYRAAI